MPTPQEIQARLLAYLQKQETLFPTDKTTSMTLAMVLISTFRENLPKTCKNNWRPLTDFQNAQEIANRQCQILRKSGKITFSRKDGWKLTELGKNHIPVRKILGREQTRPKEMENIEIHYLGLTENQLRVVRTALDTYCRLGIGQFEIAGEVICDLHAKKAQELDVTSWDLKTSTFGPLKEKFGFPTNGSFGIASPNTPEDAKIAHDVQNAISKRLNPNFHGLTTSKEKTPEFLQNT